MSTATLCSAGAPTHIAAQHRALLVEWLFALNPNPTLGTVEVLFSAVQYMDTLLRRAKDKYIPLSHLQCVGVACLSLAMKYHGGGSCGIMTLEELADLTQGACSADNIGMYEHIVVCALQFNFRADNAYQRLIDQAAPSGTHTYVDVLHKAMPQLLRDLMSDPWAAVTTV